MTLDDLADMASGRGTVAVLAFDSRRYVGRPDRHPRPQGKKVGRVGRTRNTEYLHRRRTGPKSGAAVRRLPDPRAAAR